MKHIDYLMGLRVCDPGLRYIARYQSPREALERCHRPNWLLWLLEKAGVRDARRYRLYACWCVRNTPLGDGRTVWDLLTDERSRAAVIMAERYADGHVSRAQLSSAAAAAAAAAIVATSFAAAHSACDTNAHSAIDAAYDASYDAIYSAIPNVSAARRAQANELREMFAAAFDMIEAKAEGKE
ncbi:MAG: hypothetical protein WC455_27625, partial [Dehalococcoidia bacterium]